MSAGLSQSRFHTSPAAAAPSDAFAAADLTCPRCGYDQSGLEQSLRSQCERGELDAWPLKSTCAECGREFQWGNIYNMKPRESEFFETATTRPFRALWKTVWRMPRAGRFWKGVSREWPVSVWRLCAVGAIACVVWLTACAILVIAIATRLESAYSARWDPLLGGIPLLEPGRKFGRPDPWWVAVPLENMGNGMRDRIPGLQASLLLAFAITCVLPLTMALFTRVARTLPIARLHFARIWIYSLPGLLIVTVLTIAIPRMAVPLSLLCSDWMAGGHRDREYLNGWEVSPFRERWHPMLLAACILIFTWWWWTCALRDYLKVARPGLLTAAALLISGAICYLVAVQLFQFQIDLFPL